MGCLQSNNVLRCDEQHLRARKCYQCSVDSFEIVQSQAPDPDAYLSLSGDPWSRDLGRVKAKLLCSLTATNVDVREANAPHLSHVSDKGVHSVAIPWSETVSDSVDNSEYDGRCHNGPHQVRQVILGPGTYGIDRRGLFCDRNIVINPDNVRQLGVIFVAKSRILGTSEKLSNLQLKR